VAENILHFIAELMNFLEGKAALCCLTCFFIFSLFELFGVPEDIRYQTKER